MVPGVTVGVPLVCDFAVTKEGVRLTMYCAAATDIPQPHNGETYKRPPRAMARRQAAWLGAGVAKVG